MIEFAELFRQLDSTTKTNEKVDAICRYLELASPSDAAWAIFFLSGNKLRRLVPTGLLRQWAAERAQIPSWLFDESYQSVGDLAETLSLIVPEGIASGAETLASWVENRLIPLGTMDEAEQKATILEIWSQTNIGARLVVMKLLTGGFRVGVSKRLVTRAISKHANIPVDVVAHRMMGDFEPTGQSFIQLSDPDHQDQLPSRPYPFCLAHPIDEQKGTTALGDVFDYLAEWKWDGIRGQVIRRDDGVYIWSRGEELMEKRWPEIEQAAMHLPNGTVIDGEILACRQDGQVLPFSQLQRRIGRKKVGKKLLHEVPVAFFAFDLLEADGVDLRAQPLSDRRRQLIQLIDQRSHSGLKVTQEITGSSWDELDAIRLTCREHQSEGLMLKRRDSSYEVGRTRGAWWKWKISPHTIDAVLIYAQKGHGRRSGLFTDYTFAVWDNEQLVPFAKAYSGLDDGEIRKVDHFIRRNTKETFGPVRSVTPELVMELAFEGLQYSKRHKSGVATRFPRIVRWRHDKRPENANTLQDLLSLLPEQES